MMKHLKTNIQGQAGTELPVVSRVNELNNKFVVLLLFEKNLSIAIEYCYA